MKFLSGIFTLCLTSSLLHPRIFSVFFFSTPLIYVHLLGLYAKFLIYFYMTALIIGLRFYFCLLDRR
jgi:hypothetical protein